MGGKVVRGNRITRGSIFEQPLLFFFPILLGTFPQQLYNTTDVMVVGRFAGEQALAAVGRSTSTLINLPVGFSVGLSSGATVIISQFYDARKANKVRWAAHTSIAFSVIGGIIFMIVGLVGLLWALEVMKMPEDVVGHMVVYIRVYFPGIIANLAYNVGVEILHTVGDSKQPLYLLTASRFTNIILDVLLVAVLGIGVADAALAIITSQLLSAVLVVLILMKTDDMYKPEWKKMRIDQRMLQRIAHIGIPTGMQFVMYDIPDITIQAGVDALGTDNVTTWVTCGKVDGPYWMMISTLGISATTFVGQNFGAGRLDHVRKGVGACMVIDVALTMSMRVVLYNDGYLLMELFTTNQQTQATSMDLLHFMVPTFITYITVGISSSILGGAEDAWTPLIITGIGVCAVRVLRTMSVLPHYHTIIGTAFYYPLTQSLTMAAFVIYYYLSSSLRRWKLKPLKRRFSVYKPL